MIRLEYIFARRLEDVLKTSSKRLQDFLKVCWRRFSRRVEDVLKTSWRCLEDILKTSWRFLEDVLQDVLKTSWKRLENVLKTSWRRMAKTKILVLTKLSWRRLEDTFWRHKAKANKFVLVKTSSRRYLKTKTKDVFKTFSRRLQQDECLLGLCLICAALNTVLISVKQNKARLSIGLCNDIFHDVVRYERMKS